MKKALTFLVVFTMVFLLVACTQQPAAPVADPAVAPAAETASPAETPVEALPETPGEEEAIPQGDWVIGLSNSYYGNTWRKQMVDAFESVAEEAKASGYISDYVVMNGDGTVNAQISQIESLILQGVDAICINAASPNALNGALQKAIDAGITVISFDSNVQGLDGCYVMDYDMKALGRVQGEYIVDRFDGNANVVVVRGISGSTPALNIYEGYMEEFNAASGIKILCEVNGEASATVTQEELLKVIGNLDHVDAVVVNTGGDSIGAVNAFEQLGMDVPVVIGDGSGEFVNWWLTQKSANGYETISVSTPPSCASGAFWTAVEILNGKDVPYDLFFDMTVVTQDEVDDYSDLQPGFIVSPVFTYEYTTENVINPARERAAN